MWEKRYYLDASSTHKYEYEAVWMEENPTEKSHRYLFLWRSRSPQMVHNFQIVIEFSICYHAIVYVYVYVCCCVCVYVCI